MSAQIALITPARNESAYLPGLIRSVTQQSLRPTVWVIVSDGSTDETDDIARAAAAEWPFIRFVRNEGGTSRDFAKKVLAFERGRSELTAPYDYIGNADADVEYPVHYFESLVGEFDRDQRLGVAGGLVVDVDDQGVVHRRPGRADIVPGAVQLFRAECFEGVGGYRQLRYGSEDTVACLAAQMAGWRTMVVTDLVVRHHRSAGTADRSLLRARFREGRRDYATGYHPAFAAAKAGRRLLERPLVVGSCARLAGFVVASIRREGPEVDPEIVAYLRERQLRELGWRR